MGALCCRSGSLEKYSGGGAAEAAHDTSSKKSSAAKLWSPTDRGSAKQARSITFAAYTQGGKSDQSSQDEALTMHKLGGDPSTHLFAVFDGHGEFGGEVSLFLKRNFPTTLLNLKDFPAKPVLALKDTCVKVNSMLKATEIDISLSGSTGCICLIMDNQLFTCNVGDSRAIAAVGPLDLPKPVQLTTDHTASNPKEKQRIIQASGRVIKKRIYTADGTLPGLIPSRSFGDLMGVKAGVVCQPDVCVYTISAEYRFVAIMSDGVWENVAAAHIAKHVVLGDSLSVAAREIVKDAERTVHAGNKYRDDMTAVLIAFHGGFGVESATGPRSSMLNDVARSTSGSSANGMKKEPDDRVAFAISICEELISQGVHPEDAPDAIMGLTEDQRQQVVQSVQGNSRCVATQPGAVSSEIGLVAPCSTTETEDSSSEGGSRRAGGGASAGGAPWYKSWLGGGNSE